MDTETSSRIRIVNQSLTSLDICDLLRDNEGGYIYFSNNNYGSNTILGEISGIFKSEAGFDYVRLVNCCNIVRLSNGDNRIRICSEQSLDIASLVDYRGRGNVEVEIFKEEEKEEFLYLKKTLITNHLENLCFIRKHNKYMLSSSTSCEDGNENNVLRFTPIELNKGERLIKGLFQGFKFFEQTWSNGNYCLGIEVFQTYLGKTDDDETLSYMDQPSVESWYKQLTDRLINYDKL